MSRPLAVIGFLVLVAGLIVGGFLAIDRLAGEEATETVIDKPQLGLVQVTQTNLIETETFPAILRFADPQIITAPIAGTVTALPAENSTLSLGSSVAEIDGQPVVVFYGDRPMWRSLALPLDGSELEGPDVRQLESNLLSLGYPSAREDEDELPSIGPADDLFDEDTVRLIEDWREDIGLSAGGFVEAGRILYLTEDVRVARVLVSKGALILPGTPLLETSASDQEVFLQLPVDRRELVEVGDAVEVTLPDDTIVSATVVEVGTIVTYLEDDAPRCDQREYSTRRSQSWELACFDESPVDVEIISNEVVDALAVPVNALLALAEGGYAVEINRDGVVSLIPVETGIYVDGLVEITGELVAGDSVVAPK